MIREDEPIDILALTCWELGAVFQRRFGKGRFHAEALYRQVFQKGICAPAALWEFAASGPLSDDVVRAVRVSLPRIVEERTDGAVVKWASGLSDGSRVESVVISMPRAKTVCVSSQVGCRMGCAFCRTGKMGFVRQLGASEIVGQVLNARLRYGEALRNVVFMGMGEPLDNMDAVFQAIAVMADPRGLAIARRRITLSTVGVGSGLEALALQEPPRVRVAISLNAAMEKTRSALMPVSRWTPLARLKEILSRYPLGKKETFLFGYVLMRGVNDSLRDARALADFVRPFQARVNLIALNPFEDCPFEAPEPETLERFRSWLVSEGLFVRKRTPRGGDLMAACGQLGGGSAVLSAKVGGAS